MKKVVKGVFSLGTLLAAMAMEVQAETYYVSNTGDDGAAGTQGAPLKSLSVALGKAVDGDTIHICAGDHTGMTTTTETIGSVSGYYLGVVSKAVTIEGEGEANTILHGSNTSGEQAYRKGGIYLNNAAATVKNLAFTDLFTTWTDDDQSYAKVGAALWVNAGTASVCRVFNNNTGGINGRVPPVRVSGTGVLVDSIITNNVQGGYGKAPGGLYLANGEVRRCLIAFNQGPEKNAPNGVWVAGGTLAESVIYKNVHRSSGVGTYGVQVAGGTVERCVIAENKGATAGGVGVTGTATVRNCLIWGNTSTSSSTTTAGGLFVNSAGAAVHHVTVVGNTGSGGCDGVYLATGTVVGTVSSGNRLIDWVAKGGSSSCCCFVGAGEGDFDADPQFLPAEFTYHPTVAEYDSFRIGRFSVCRNAGTYEAAVVTDDLVGAERPAVGTGAADLPDLGCYEIQAAGEGEFYVGVTTPNAVVPSGDDAVFAAAEEGGGATVARYVWTVTSGGVSKETETETPSFTVKNPAGGVCTVSLKAYDGSGNLVGSAERSVTVKPRDVFVSLDGGNVFPYARPQDAARTVTDAVAAVYCEESRPGRVYVAPGNYPETPNVAMLLNPIELIGDENPERVVLRFKSGTTQSGITVNHPMALVHGVTLTGSATGSGDEDYKHGGAFHIAQGVVSNCVVTGFNTLNFRSMSAVAIETGGTFTDSTVSNNSNSSTAYARGVLGVYMAGGTIERTVIANNKFNGDRAAVGAFWMADGTARDLFITNNSVKGQSSGEGITVGARVAGGTFERCVVADNVNGDSANGDSVGGLAVTGAAVVRNVLVRGNVVNSTAAGSVGGLLVNSAGADVRHVTVTGNSAVSAPGGLLLRNGTVRGSISSGNVGSADSAISGGTISYSCYPSATGADGNIADAPNFADADGRLARSSPCRDAARYGETLATDDLEGLPRVPYGESATDFPDMGCYELQASAELTVSIGTSTEDTFAGDTVVLTAMLEGPETAVAGTVWKVTANGLTATYEREGATLTLENVGAGRYGVEVTATTPGGLTADDAKPDWIKVRPSRCYVALGGSDTWPYDTEDKAASNLCDAVDAVWSTDTSRGEVWVKPGVYTDMKLQQQGVFSRLAIINRNVAVLGKGQGPEDVWMKVHSAAEVSAVTVGHADALLANVTLSAEAKVKNDQGVALALHVSDGTVSNCVLRDCQTLSGSERTRAPLYVEGGSVSGVRIVNNSFFEGFARHALGAVVAGGTLENAEISGNSGDGDQNNGSALVVSGTGVARNVIVRGNSRGVNKGSSAVTSATGVTLSGGKLINALVVGNACTQPYDTWSAGLRLCGGKAVNVTVADNEAGGVACEQLIFTSGTLANSIVEGNASPVQATVSSLVTTEPVAFRNRAKGDYQLTRLAQSCLDCGDDTQWTDLKNAVDLLGNPRKRGRHVDLGCYELLPGLLILLR